MSIKVLKITLPWPVRVVFRPLLMTPRDSDLVGRMVFLVTDQIWTIVLAIFLNYCHSTRGNGSLLSTASAIYFGALIFPGSIVRKVHVSARDKPSPRNRFTSREGCSTFKIRNPKDWTNRTSSDGRGTELEEEDCFSWCPRRSNPRVSFSPQPPPLSHAVLLLIGRVHQEVI